MSNTLTSEMATKIIEKELEKGGIFHPDSIKTKEEKILALKEIIHRLGAALATLRRQPSASAGSTRSGLAARLRTGDTGADGTGQRRPRAASCSDDCHGMCSADEQDGDEELTGECDGF